MDLIASWIAWGFFHCVFTLLFLPLQLALLVPAFLWRWARGDLRDLGTLLVAGGLLVGQLLVAWASKNAADRFSRLGHGPVQSVLGTLGEARQLLSFVPLFGKRSRPPQLERGGDDGAA